MSTERSTSGSGHSRRLAGNRVLPGIACADPFALRSMDSCAALLPLVLAPSRRQSVARSGHDELHQQACWWGFQGLAPLARGADRLSPPFPRWAGGLSGRVRSSGAGVKNPTLPLSVSVGSFQPGKGAASPPALARSVLGLPLLTRAAWAGPDLAFA